MKTLIPCALLLLTAACTTQPLEPYDVAFGTAPVATGYPTPLQPVASTAPHRTELSQAELSQCVALDRSAKSDVNLLAATSPDLQYRRAQIAEEQRLVEARRATLDTRSPAQVEEYNRRVADLAAFTVDYNTDTRYLQGSADTIGRAVASYNQDCAGRPYRYKDMAEITGDRNYRLGGPRR
ncbi:MAG TPA: hypothetical protein VM074_05535 [Solimonas sp.]|nr:hypothetical protein [Solimonas sp.]